MLERLLIVGLGSIGSRHLRIARTLLPNACIGVLRHRACAELAESGADHCFTRLDAALAFEPQAAVVASPATRHLDSALPLARAGVHLLVEKPLSGTADGVGELIDTSRRMGTVLQAGYNLRFSPTLQRFRDLLQSGTIGRCYSVRAEIGQFLPSWRPGTDYRQGVSARRDLGGGALLELSHELDYLRWAFGDIAWVQATLRRQSDLDIDVEDTAHLALGFVPSSDGRQLVGSLDMDFIRRDPVRQCTAVGEAGSLRWNGLLGSVEQFRADGSAWEEIFRSSPERDETYVAEWRQFIGAVLGGHPTAASGEDGLRVLEIIDAARVSDAAHGVRHPVTYIRRVNGVR
jgi:predicted dehydrogenase